MDLLLSRATGYMSSSGTVYHKTQEVTPAEHMQSRNGSRPVESPDVQPGFCRADEDLDTLIRQLESTTILARGRSNSSNR